MTATIDTPTATIPATSTLPDGDTLGNDILASAGSRQIRTLLRKAAAGATVRKARRSNEPPRVMFTPRAWTLGGRVD